MKTTMRTGCMQNVEEASALIRAGRRLIVAGDEHLLAALPLGDWVGGTIPYFMTEEGGRCSHELLQVTVLPETVTAVRVKTYEADAMEGMPRDYAENGFSLMVIPAFTEAHQKFARECAAWPGIFDRPLVGWIAGVDLKDIGTVRPQVRNGQTGEMSATSAVAMHLSLPDELIAEANILNLFNQGRGDVLTFDEKGLEVSTCKVNGERVNFARNLASHAIDTRLPLVADYAGAMINVSFQGVDNEAGLVTLYAPVFPGVAYRLAAPVGDYAAEFARQMDARSVEPVFACNCILNYLYARLEGKKTGSIVGPITFGEIGYMLLNQTLVYLTIAEK